MSLLYNRSGLEKAVLPYLKHLSDTGYFMEIGVFQGDGVALWKKFLADNGKDYFAIGVDPFLLAPQDDREGIMRDARASFTLMPNSKLIEKRSDEFWDSEEAISMMGKIPFMMIDGDHTDAMVIKDCKGAKALVAPQAIIILDDVHCLSNTMKEWIVNFWDEDWISYIYGGPIHQMIIFHGIEEVSPTDQLSSSTEGQKDVDTPSAGTQ